MSKRTLYCNCLLAGAVLFLGSAGCDLFDILAFSASEDFAFSQPYEDVGALVVDWRIGDVNVRIDPDATEITVAGTKRTNALSQGQAEGALDDLDIQLLLAESDPIQAFLTFGVPTETAYTYSADVEIVLPGPLTLTIGNAVGEVTVEGNEALTNVNVHVGDAYVRDQVGNTVVTVTAGNAEIEAAGGEVNAQVDTGDLLIEAAPAAEDVIEATVEFGNLTLRVPADFAAALLLIADLGTVETDLSAFEVTDLQTSRGEVSATLNGGGGAINAETGVGGITFEGPAVARAPLEEGGLTDCSARTGRRRRVYWSAPARIVCAGELLTLRAPPPRPTAGLR